MKRILILFIFIVSILISFGYSQFAINNTQFNMGGGLGFGKGGVSIEVGFIFGRYTEQNKRKVFVWIGSNSLFNGRGEQNTYDFSPNLFDDDEDRGKLDSDLWLIGGAATKLKNNMELYLGGGLNIHNAYFKRYDEMEILGDGNGIYYIVDDDATEYLPTLLIGVANKNIGIYYNTFPNNISFVYWFSLWW